MLSFPVLGLLFCLAIYFYMRRVYRNVVLEVNDNNHMEFKDLEHYNQKYSTNTFLNYPVYIDRISKDHKQAETSNFNFHK